MRNLTGALARNRRINHGWTRMNTDERLNETRMARIIAKKTLCAEVNHEIHETHEMGGGSERFPKIETISQELAQVS